MEEDFDALVENEIPTTTALIGMILVLFALFNLSLYFIHDSAQQNHTEQFQRILTSGIRAYSTTYSEEHVDLAKIAEGYVTSEDIDIYSVNTNPIVIDRGKASQYLLNILSTDLGYSTDYLKTLGVYVVDIVTEFNPSTVYRVSIYKDGEILHSYNNNLTTLEAVQSFVDTALDINTDLAVGYNDSLKDAVEYNRGVSSTGSGQATYSTLSTSTVIIKQVPVKNINGTAYVPLKSMQTYTIKRGE